LAVTVGKLRDRDGRHPSGKIGKFDMFETFAHWLHDDTFLTAYIAVLLAVMVLPMVLLARWYHGNINETEGGQKLMERQNASGVRNLGAGVGMMRDISAGKYGDEAKRMQKRVSVYILSWVLAVGALAGLMITAQELYPKPGSNSQNAPAVGPNKN
jgi:hypothetical protein